MSAKEFDERFDAGESVTDLADFEISTKIVNIELPTWAVRDLDKEASRRGVARQALMKMGLVDRLDRLRGKGA